MLRPSLENPKTSWIWWFTLVILATWEGEIQGSQSRLVWAKSKSLSQQKGLEVWLKQ
jgi:hypothetical protein